MIDSRSPFSGLVTGLFFAAGLVLAAGLALSAMLGTSAWSKIKNAVWLK
jgi:hypothetical protein